MHKLTFFPLGNADCCLIDLDNGEKILLDYANTGDSEDDEDLRCDLAALLRTDLENTSRDYFDVVGFTHLDEDHYKGASEFFYLEHAQKYQGEGRIKINTLWVPATTITETSLDNAEAKVLQNEARHRFKMGKGIRVFSRPGKLQDWCDASDVSLEDRKHLVTDAGTCVPEYRLDRDGVEFFVHSPFAKRLNDDEVEDRNADSLVLHGTFQIQGVETRVLFLADTPNEVLADIVQITRDVKGRPERLEWDVAKLPHHCSYLSLGNEIGKTQTQPIDDVAWLWENAGQTAAIIVSTSKPIPIAGSDEDKDNNPPHRQAANYYKAASVSNQGRFVVTMEHPSEHSPKPLVIEIDHLKATLKLRSITASVAATTSRPPRAG